MLKIFNAATVQKKLFFLGGEGVAKSSVLEVAVFKNHMVPLSPSWKQSDSQNYWYLICG